MAVVLATMQLLAISGLIFGAVVIGWRAGVRYWSSRP
jgi:hypothetical protein